jgi:hypothetical protein
VQNLIAVSIAHRIGKKEEHYVAQCLNADISSFGASGKEALETLIEVLILYFEENAHSDIQGIEQQ